jgi:polyisoprenoid-binding protein YceI
MATRKTNQFLLVNPVHLFCALALLLLGGWEVTAGEVALDLQKSWIKANAKATGHSFETKPEQYSCILTTNEAHQLVSAEFSCTVLSLKTEKDGRDKELYHWLESTKFGQITFKMKELRLTQGKHMMVGTLTLHNVSQVLEIPVTFSNQGNKLELVGDVTIDTTKFALPIIRKMAFLTVKPEVAISFVMVGKEVTHDGSR